MEQNFVEKGWQCPVCGAVMSPRERVCVNCKGNANIGISIPNITTPAPYIGLETIKKDILEQLLEKTND